jgi:Superinfection exclusion gene product 17
MSKQKNKLGDLQVWWIPQIPMDSFMVPVKDVEEGAKLLDVLANYDMFQFKNNIKPDYCNAGGLNMFDADCDGDGNAGWCDWYDEETGEEDPHTYLAEKAIKQ